MANLHPICLNKLLDIIFSWKNEILAFKVFKICYHSVYCSIVYIMLFLNNSLLKLFSQNRDKICPEVRFSEWTGCCSFDYIDIIIYIRHTCNLTNMFQYVSKYQFFKFCRNIASVSIFCPDNAKSVNVRSNIKIIKMFSLPILQNVTYKLY